MVEHWPSKPVMRVRSPSSALEEDAPVAQWTEQRPSKPSAGGSNPPGRRWLCLKMGSVAQVVSALGCGPRGRGFESRRSSQKASS